MFKIYCMKGSFVMEILLALFIMGCFLGFIGAGGAGVIIAILTIVFGIPIHGAYKFKGTPQLDFQRLEKISQLLSGFPLVLHGASTVIPEFVEKCNLYGGDIPGAQGVPEDMRLSYKFKMELPSRCDVFDEKEFFWYDPGSNISSFI